MMAPKESNKEDEQRSGGSDPAATATTTTGKEAQSLPSSEKNNENDHDSISVGSTSSTSKKSCEEKTKHMDDNKNKRNDDQSNGGEKDKKDETNNAKSSSNTNEDNDVGSESGEGINKASEVQQQVETTNLPKTSSVTATESHQEGSGSSSSSSAAVKPHYICVGLNDRGKIGITVNDYIPPKAKDKLTKSSSSNIITNENDAVVEASSTSEQTFVHVQRVHPNSQAEREGLKVGDVIVTARSEQTGDEWNESMSYQKLLSILGSNDRPILLQVRRYPAVSLDQSLGVAGTADGSCSNDDGSNNEKVAQSQEQIMFPPQVPPPPFMPPPINPLPVQLFQQQQQYFHWFQQQQLQQQQLGWAAAVAAAAAASGGRPSNFLNDVERSIQPPAAVAPKAKKGLEANDITYIATSESQSNKKKGNLKKRQTLDLERREDLARTRRIREGIRRAHELYVAANEIEYKNFGTTQNKKNAKKSFVHPDEEEDEENGENEEEEEKEGEEDNNDETADNSSNTGATNGLSKMAEYTLRQTIQNMREEAEALWNHPSQDKWERNFKWLLKYILWYGHCSVGKDHVAGDINEDEIHDLSFACCLLPPTSSDGKPCFPECLLRYVKRQRSNFLYWKRKDLVNEKTNRFKQGGKDYQEMCFDILKQVGFFNHSLEPKTRQETSETNWNMMYNRLVQFKEKFGHCDVRQKKNNDESNNNDYYELARWVSRQRFLARRESEQPKDDTTKQKKKSKIPPLTNEQRRKLNDIGFMWELETLGGQQTWEAMFQELQNYKEKYGNCNVPVAPKHGKRNPFGDLSRWVTLQRKKYKEWEKLKPGETPSEDMITDDQIELMNQLGFMWDAKGVPWERMVERLKEYKEVHGHCSIPIKKPDPQWKDVSRFVGYSRYKYVVKKRTPEGQPIPKNLIITDEQIKELTDIGMIWNAAPEKKWEDYYNDLVIFYNEHGHSNVPQNYPENIALGSWVHRIRRLKREYDDGRNLPVSFSEERRKLLEDLDFQWITRKPSRDARRANMEARLKKQQQKQQTGEEEEEKDEQEQQEEEEEQQQQQDEQDDEEEQSVDDASTTVPTTTTTTALAAEAAAISVRQTSTTSQQQQSQTSVTSSPLVGRKSRSTAKSKTNNNVRTSTVAAGKKRKTPTTTVNTTRSSRSRSAAAMNLPTNKRSRSSLSSLSSVVAPYQQQHQQQQQHHHEEDEQHSARNSAASYQGLLQNQAAALADSTTPVATSQWDNSQLNNYLHQRHDNPQQQQQQQPTRFNNIPTPPQHNHAYPHHNNPPPPHHHQQQQQLQNNHNYPHHQEQQYQQSSSYDTNNVQGYNYHQNQQQQQSHYSGGTNSSTNYDTNINHRHYHHTTTNPDDFDAFHQNSNSHQSFLQQQHQQQQHQHSNNHFINNNNIFDNNNHNGQHQLYQQQQEQQEDQSDEETENSYDEVSEQEEGDESESE